MKLGEKESLRIPAITSGSLLIDIAIGCGGYPRGGGHKNFCSGIIRKDNNSFTRNSISPKERRKCSIYRCRART